MSVVGLDGDISLKPLADSALYQLNASIAVWYL